MKQCAVCEKGFVPYMPMARVCSLPCARKVPVIKRKAERADTRARKEAAKTRKKLIAEAQTAFNRWIRLRDYGQPCICCGSPMEWSSSKPGGEIDAGHYLSVGSAPHLRFDECNANAQRKSCNRPGGTSRIMFRAGMVERIGIQAVERLEADQTLRKYTADELRAIRDQYRARAREWRKEMA